VTYTRNGSKAGFLLGLFDCEGGGDIFLLNVVDFQLHAIISQKEGNAVVYATSRKVAGSVADEVIGFFN
jgi:hypothetical protein